MTPALKVAVGIVRNNKGQILISQRHKGAHQGGLWEFPGGKVEPGEDASQALIRELFEELGIQVRTVSPFIKIRHSYDDLTVLLDVMFIDSFSGNAIGKEFQEINWVALNKLEEYLYPAANRKIISALKLPQFYPIVDESVGGKAIMFKHLNHLINQGYKMIQLRAKSLSKDSFVKLAKQSIGLCVEKGVSLYLNTSVDTAISLGASGVHLSAKRLLNFHERLNKSVIQIAVSCHTELELKKAEEVGAQFAVLSPVCKTESHPGVPLLGWKKFSQLTEKSNIPIFALGGVCSADMSLVKEHNGQGISGIRGFIPTS